MPPNDWFVQTIGSQINGPILHIHIHANISSVVATSSFIFSGDVRMLSAKGQMSFGYSSKIDDDDNSRIIA